MKGLYYLGNSTRMQIYFFDDVIERGEGMKVYTAHYIGLGYGTKIPEHYEGEDAIYRISENSSNNIYSYIRVFFGDSIDVIYFTKVTHFKKLEIANEEDILHSFYTRDELL